MIRKLRIYRCMIVAVSILLMAVTAAAASDGQSHRRLGGEKNVHILLVGTDDDGDTGSRSDTMILCTFNRREGTITLTSFLRDLYVKIPGHGKDRINAAYRFGGTKLLNETIRENFGITVDGNIEVDFSRFEKIIDLMGGVTMKLTAREASRINRETGSSLAAGDHLLTGKQALVHVRNRNDPDGDFSRTARQRQLLHAMLGTMRRKNMTQMLNLMREMVPLVQMDISKTDLTRYAMTLFPMLAKAELRLQSIPAEGAYSYQTIGGKSVLVPDLKKNLQVIADTLI